MRAKTWFLSRWGRLSMGVIVLLGCLLLVTEAGAVKPKGEKPVKSVTLSGLVTDSHDRPLVGATVYLIDSSTLDLTPIKPADILSGVSAAYDEPLEDIVNDPIKGKALPQAVTDASGKYSIKSGLSAASKYFAFVQPATADVDHLPGGDASRVAFSPVAQSKNGLQIHMSWKAPSDATYIGTTACYVCHGAGAKLDVTSNKKHGHALMFTKPGQDSPNQNSAAHNGSNWGELAAKFTLATQVAGKAPVGTPATGSTTVPAVEVLYVQDYDASTATNNGVAFCIYENTPGTTQVYAKLYLWKDATNKYYVTIENVIAGVLKKTDPNNFKTFEVPLMIGGYIRQRLLLKVPGLKGLYKFIGYQAITGSASQGLAKSYDRTRKAFSIGGAGGGSFTDFFEISKTNPNFGEFMIKYPLSKAVALPIPPSTTAANPASNIACAACHLGYGTSETFVDATTGETLTHTVDDPNGLYDLGGDGKLQDMGINCEQCHGPGSKHREENLKALALPKSKKPVKKNSKSTASDTTGKYIVQPEMLGADRASVICGRCHSGMSFVSDDAPVGISRKEFLAKFVNPLQQGLAQSKLWDNVKVEGGFSKGGHEGSTYADYMCSKHNKNSRQLVACSDCHDAMGDSSYRYSLKGDPDDSTTSASLCLKCHAKNVVDHVTAKTGSVMKGEGMKCIDCHMTRTGKGGAGRPGLIVGTPVGINTNASVSPDANITYWQNDQSSHGFYVPTKFNMATAGVQPGGLFPNTQREAMPTPYTNSCGTCHDASKLQYQAPGTGL